MPEPIFEITYLNGKNIRARLHPSARATPKPWSWPLADFAGRAPIILDNDPGERHAVDLGYVAAPYDSDLFVPVIASQAGEVSMAMNHPDGFAVSIVHGDWTTHYAHLSKMLVTPCIPRSRRRQSISAGQVIGYAAKSPLHVRFELWQWTDESGFVPVDPIPYLNDWTVPTGGNDRRATTEPEAA